MFKRILPLVIMILMATAPGYAEKLADLTQLMEPHFIAVDGDELIIGEELTIRIYSLKDLKFKRSFGKQGEGPKEFLSLPGRRWLKITVLKESIVISSLGKVSTFDRAGTFIEEIKTLNSGYYFKAMNQGLAGFKNVFEDNIAYQTVYLFDNAAKPVKELYREKHKVRQSGEMWLLKHNQLYVTGPDRIYLALNKDLNINIYDPQGKQVSKIEKSYGSPRKVTGKDRRGIHGFMKQKYADSYPRYKHLIRIPDVFPPLVSRVGLSYDHNGGNPRLYLLSWKKEGEKSECFVCNPKDKSFKRVLLPLSWVSFLQPGPFTVHKGTLYQLIENQETENWELHKTRVK